MTTNVYRNVLSTGQDRMSKAVAQIRSAIPHPGEIGGLVERVFRTHLVEILPEKVGVSNGFVVDSLGGVSRQMDIVLYDRQGTPRVFTSEGPQIFPVESTYACGEVKTKLNAKEIRDSFDKCKRYKNLVRRAYAVPSRGRTHRLFGREYKHWQSVFFCVGAETVPARHLSAAYRKVVEAGHLAVEQRLDTVMALNAGKGANNARQRPCRRSGHPCGRLHRSATVS